MSDKVKLGSKLPGDFEVNGVDQIADELIADPEAGRLAVVWFDVAKVTHDTDTGEDVPTIRVRRIEPIGEVGDVSQTIIDLVQSKIEERTGRKPLPFEVVEIVSDQGTFADDTVSL